MKHLPSLERAMPVIGIVATLLAAAVFFTACTIGRQDVQLEAPELVQVYDQEVARLEAAESRVKTAEQALEVAVQTPDASDDQAAAEELGKANLELQSAEERLAAIENEILQRRGAAVGGPLNTLLPGAGALVMAAVPLLGKRGRKLYASAFRNGTRGKLLTAAGDILKALGAQHSTPQPPTEA